MFDNISTDLLCVVFAFIDVNAARFYNMTDLHKALFYELAERSRKE